MIRENGTVRDIQVAYIGGGSRGWAWGFMKDLAADPAMCGTVKLYDIDIPAAQNNKIIGDKISANPAAKAHWKYEVSETLADALTGADFVVISILPGTFDEMESDVHLPEKYGIYQSVGDTVGPGGFMRAMRTLPMFVEFAEGIRQYCPQAWVINYTNPMSLCVRVLYEVFPQIRAFGCCHEVFGTQELLAAMLNDQLGIAGVNRQEIKTNVLGINHFTWLDKAEYQGMDLFPVYQKFVDKYYSTGYILDESKHWMNSTFSSAHRVKFDLFRRYGLIAAAGDRHLVEFLPPWYNSSPEQVREWCYGLTTVAWRKQDLQERLARSQRLVNGEEEIDMQPSGEEGHLLIKALLGLQDMVSNVNIPNAGQIPNLPVGAVVETNALFRSNEIAPVMAGPLPGNILPLVVRHVYNQENALQVALTCNRKLGFTTFMNDPQVNLSYADGQILFDDMLSGTQKYLPSGWGFQK